MPDPIQTVDSPQAIIAAAEQLRRVFLEKELLPDAALDVFERWSAALAKGGAEVPGLAFLRLWLRRGTLEPLLERELGPGALNGAWRTEGQSRLRAFPLGVVGHWPAGNVEIQPVLSMTCALLGGNVCLVRVPRDAVQATWAAVRLLREADAAGTVSTRVAFVAFDHDRRDLHEAMAGMVDGAMIWGGAEAVSSVRALPFPPWARLAVFGPRLSVAAMDAESWNSPTERAMWCQRIARDVWQFDQQACSSPQTLFLERARTADSGAFVRELKRAFEEENRLHPRREITASQASAICLARASWLLGNTRQTALFPMPPDWTILIGAGVGIPKPVQNRTLTVLLVDDLADVISRFDGTVQTLGLAIGQPEREAALADAAGRKGVDRIVKLGRMHVFSSPWDGMDLVRPMVRVVRHVPSQN